MVAEYASGQQERGSGFERWKAAAVRASARPIGIEIYTMYELRQVIDVGRSRLYGDVLKGRGKLMTRC